MQHKENAESLDTVERERERESHSLYNQGFTNSKEYLCGNK